MELKKLFEAASSGNIELLNTITQQNPLILTDVLITSPEESVLHVATKAGQLESVREILAHHPGLVSELSKDGYRPMDIASILGNVEIVREFLKIDRQICRLEGKDQTRALHYAAINGRIEVINELLSACPESIKDVTAGGETAVHLAVKNNQAQAFVVLLKWLERLAMKDIVNSRDHNGNTVLHVAASRKQLETVKLLLDSVGEKLDVNARNLKGLTAMDILDIVMENPNDVHLLKILQHHVTTTITPSDSTQKYSIKHNESTKQNPEKEEHSKNWFKYFKFQPGRDSPNDTRNALLVVAALIATITFQAGVNLPTGILKLTTDEKSMDGNSPDGNDSTPPANAGTAIQNSALASGLATYLFLFTNSAGLTSSLSIIMYLTAGFPFQRELLMAMYCMVFSYGFSIGSITNKPSLTYSLLGIALILPLLLRWLPFCGEKAWKWWKKVRVNKKTILAI